MSQSDFGYSVKSLCRLLGISRQGYYKHKDIAADQTVLISSIVLYCQYLRQPDHLPKAGSRELYELSRQYFKEKFTIGRDKFYGILRANDLMLRRRRYRPRTTDSRHPHHIYPDLLNCTPKLIPHKSGRLMVADITYVCYKDGFAYLSLLTDAHSRYIVGHSLYPSLETKGPLQALKNALELYRSLKVDISQLIHHSDRGVQYASKEYVNLLKDSHIQISMTQDGDPLHNALAERMNNTLKNGWLFNDGTLSFDQVTEAINQAVVMYNTARPHQSLDMKVPMQLISGSYNNPLLDKACCPV